MLPILSLTKKDVQDQCTAGFSEMIQLPVKNKMSAELTNLKKKKFTGRISMKRLNIK